MPEPTIDTPPTPGVGVGPPTSQVAPWILEQVGDAARPRAGLDPCRDIAHLPGEGSLLAGMHNLAGMVRRGEDLFIRTFVRYGPVYRTRLANLPIVCVVDPDHVVGILRNEDGAWSAALGWWNLAGGLSDSDTIDGPVALDSAPHREARRLLQPAFSSSALESYVGVAQDTFDRELDGWFERGHVRFKPAVRRLLASVAGRIFMGADDPSEAERLDRELAAYWRGLLAPVRNAVISPTFRRARAGRAALHAWLSSQVEPRRSGPPRTDLFSRLCQTDIPTGGRTPTGSTPNGSRRPAPSTSATGRRSSPSAAEPTRASERPSPAPRPRCSSTACCHEAGSATPRRPTCDTSTAPSGRCPAT